MKPLIGINVDLEEGPPPIAKVYIPYYEAIQKAGGIPLLIPPLSDEDLEQLMPTLSGLVMIGGDDYSPALYGESTHPSVIPLHPRREDFDLRLIRRVLKDKNMPLLGICGGFQALNIVFGGSLIQDIASQLPESKIDHKSTDGWRRGWNMHSVDIDPQSKLAKIYKATKLDVNTNHHQTVKALGKGLKASAFAEDGTIEAIESTSHPFVIGVEWHPERDLERNAPLFHELMKQSALVGSTSR